MEVVDLKAIAADLKAFVDKEMVAVKSSSGVNNESLKIAVGVVSGVVKKLDEVKAKFQALTDEQMHELAVDAVLDLILYLLAARLGGIGKWLVVLIPAGTKRQIAGVIVDVCVALIHKDVVPAV
jgi:hypothetical protein